MVKKYRKIIIIRKYRKKRFIRKKILLKNIFYHIKFIKIIFILFFSIIFLYFTIKKDPINKIHIAVNLDHHYIYPFIVFLTSLLDNKARASFYIIHILTNNSTTIDCIDKINSIKKNLEKNLLK